jgi:hypothetical protein
MMMMMMMIDDGMMILIIIETINDVDTFLLMLMPDAAAYAVARALC